MEIEAALPALPALPLPRNSAWRMEPDAARRSLPFLPSLPFPSTPDPKASKQVWLGLRAVANDMPLALAGSGRRPSEY